MANEKKTEKLVIISGPSVDDLMTIFHLQHKEYLLEPPFATLRVRKTQGIKGEDVIAEVELAFYPTKIEYLDQSGRNISIAGHIACISTYSGYRISMSAVYADGHYDAESKIGCFDIDSGAFNGSKFREQFSQEVEKKAQKQKRRPHRTNINM